ncbi:lipoprotein [Rhodoferax sp.]|uniref:LPS translocon maturation chaperone LptM n=1 Tax=Rhodoferax sp. TaxID=50421 RepID=UPI001EC953EF|nr:lipoprotein [Rhodoferax sp.]MBT9505980.1 lipoprotein [Rhodoferax sp.]
MFRNIQILVSTIALGICTVVLVGCGQQGALYLPTEPAAAKRATLPETLLRSGTSGTEPTAKQPQPSSETPTSQ